MPGNVADLARSLRDKTARAEKRTTKGGRAHPSSPKGTAYRKKPNPTSMAPREGGKRKSYGRPIPETAAEEKARRKGKGGK